MNAGSVDDAQCRRATCWPCAPGSQSALLRRATARLAENRQVTPRRVSSDRRDRMGSLVGFTRSARGLSPRVGVEDELADPDRLGRDLHALVLATELQALLEREPARRDQLLEVVRGGGAD